MKLEVTKCVVRKASSANLVDIEIDLSHMDV